MTWAAPKVEINFRTSLANADNWVDVTADVLGAIQIQRGRQSELDQYSASTCSFTLMNRSRAYDFTYAAGPYFGRLLPRTEMRITCLFSATTYNLWRGFIQGWPQGYDNVAQMATVAIQAVDRFDVLAQSHWVGGVATTYLKNLAPDFWVRSVFDGGVADDSDKTKIIQEVTSEDGKWLVTYTGNAWANSSNSDPIQSDIDSVTRLDNRGSGAGSTAGTASTPLVPANILPSSTVAFSVGGWFKTTDPSTQPQITGVAGMFALGGVLSSGGIQLNFQWQALPVGVQSRLIANVRHITGPSVSLNYDSSIADNQWHHIVVTNAVNDLRLYVDGKLVASTTAFGSNTLDDTAVMSLGFTSGGGRALWNGWAYDMFAFTRTLSPTEISNLYQAAINLPGQLSGARIQSLLNLFGMSTIPTSVAQGQSVVAPVNINGDSLLDGLLSVARAEDGQLYVDTDGTLISRGRLDLLSATRSTTLQATFDDTGSNIRYLEASPTLDVQFMYNQVTTSREGGTPFQVNNVASQAAYGVRSLDRSNLALASDNDVISQAQWSLQKYGLPSARLPFVKYSARASSAAMTAALSLTLMDRIRISRTPQGLGSAWSFDAHIEGITMNIDMSALTWEISYDLTQTSVISGYLKLDNATDHIDTGKLAG